MSDEKAWICTVCGYIHNGADAPDLCPVCGAGKDDFEPYTEPVVKHSGGVPSSWRCVICGYIHEGRESPEDCPVCGAEKDQFEPQHTAEPESQAVTAGGRFVIAGAGVAGVSAAEKIREHSPQAEITLLSTEAEVPYYRLNLTRYLAGEIARDTLPIHSAAWYKENAIELICDAHVEQLDTAGRKITLSGGGCVPYDKLIFTTGSHPFIPPLDGVKLNGVMTLRTAADADAILEAVKRGVACVCIGGGVLGIETAGALARQGADVTMLESHAWLMPRQLNERAGAVLEQHMTELGVKVLKNARTALIEGEECVSGIKLQDGRRIPAGLVILATGVRPNTVLARKAGLEVNSGIVVDNHMRTSVAEIYAAGDVAEHNGQLYGAWAASQFQGAIAALNAVGISTPFGGLSRASTIKALGIDITSIGRFMPEDGSYIVLEEAQAGKYTCYVMHDGRITGAILIGNAGLAAKVKQAVEEGRDFSRGINSVAGISAMLQ